MHSGPLMILKLVYKDITVEQIMHPNASLHQSDQIVVKQIRRDIVVLVFYDIIQYRTHSPNLITFKSCVNRVGNNIILLSFLIWSTMRTNFNQCFIVIKQRVLIPEVY